MDQGPLLGSTKTRIMTQLAGSPATAVQIAGALGFQVSAVRKHLDRLRTLGVVTDRFERLGPGRPKKIYSLTDDGRELFPRRYDAVLNALVSELVRDQGETGVRRALHRVAQGLAAASVPEPGSTRGQLRQLAKGLDDLGFEASFAERNGTCTITSRNCPILRTARLHRELVCQALHAEIIRAATDAPDVQRGKWIVDGDPVCTHRFSLG